VKRYTKATGNQNQVGVAIYISGKIGCKPKLEEMRKLLCISKDKNPSGKYNKSKFICTKC
jgi:hypothetical protein